MTRKGDKKLKKRGNNYYTEPYYKIPEKLPLKIVVLSLIAQNPDGVDYGSLKSQFELFCPHEKVYYIMGKYIRDLYRNGDVKKIERGFVKIHMNGWRKLKYYDIKVGLPDVLREPIQDILEEIELWQKE